MRRITSKVLKLTVVVLVLLILAIYLIGGIYTRSQIAKSTNDFFLNVANNSPYIQDIEYADVSADIFAIWRHRAQINDVKIYIKGAPHNPLVVGSVVINDYQIGKNKQLESFDVALQNVHFKNLTKFFHRIAPNNLKAIIPNRDVPLHADILIKYNGAKELLSLHVEIYDGQHNQTVLQMLFEHFVINKRLDNKTDKVSWLMKVFNNAICVSSVIHADIRTRVKEIAKENLSAGLLLHALGYDKIDMLLDAKGKTSVKDNIHSGLFSVVVKKMGMLTLATKVQVSASSIKELIAAHKEKSPDSANKIVFAKLFYKDHSLVPRLLKFYSKLMHISLAKSKENLYNLLQQKVLSPRVLVFKKALIVFRKFLNDPKALAIICQPKKPVSHAIIHNYLQKQENIHVIMRNQLAKIKAPSQRGAIVEKYQHMSVELTNQFLAMLGVRVEGE